MKRLLLLSALFVFSKTYSQYYTITGKVVDTLQQPLPGASVFAQNTTIGTAANTAGEFKIYLPDGGYNLIFTVAGYQTQSIQVSGNNKEPLTIILKPKEKEMGEVVIQNSNEVADGWEKYGKFFTENFIGSSPNAEKCTLQNPEALKFLFIKRKNKLKVLGKEDLIINNNELGYRIRYKLDSFIYEYNTDISGFLGYPFYEEMEGSDSLKAVWKKNRAKTYYGSRLHFMRSYYDSSLTEEGFVLEMKDTLPGSNKYLPVTNPYDTSFYSILDSANVEISFPDEVKVIYKKARADDKFLVANKYPKGTPNQTSAIMVKDYFIIQENGFFFPQTAVVNTGYWTWKKLADMLPYDYYPE
ncbi:MAG: carboxypeptidase-like regulatory domain-containing protein [Sphingobacteriales bacterium]|nr:MAG: carboxypeptidase-like regulatory domain-containing protein [Sphingobacteriales bacterium]